MLGIQERREQKPMKKILLLDFLTFSFYVFATQIKSFIREKSELKIINFQKEKGKGTTVKLL